MAAIPSRQIGWSTEDNLLWQISKQLERLTQVTGNSVSTTTTTTTLPVHQVFTALLTQSGGDNLIDIVSGDLVIGTTYQIFNDGGEGAITADFTNVGAPNNNYNTFFIATGTTPNNWGVDTGLRYNTGAPVATVLENTIGNVWISWDNVGTYTITSNGLFTVDKSWTPTIQIFNDTAGLRDGEICEIRQASSNQYFITTYDQTGAPVDSKLLNTPIEIRVYN